MNLIKFPDNVVGLPDGGVGVYLTGKPRRGVGPQDVALAIIGAVFANGYVNNKVMEFVGPGVSGLSADFRIGVDVMTTETTCLSSIWQTDDVIREFYEIHGRTEDKVIFGPGIFHIQLRSCRQISFVCRCGCNGTSIHQCWRI